jgi:hypothetical protein
MLLLWSIKESDLAQGNCTWCTVNEYILASQKHWQLLSLSLSLAPHNSRTSQVDPNAIPSGASRVDPNAISLLTPPVHLLLGQRNPRPYLDIEPYLEDSAAHSGRKTLQNPGTRKRWSMSNRFLLFGRGIVSCWEDTLFVGQKIVEI